MTARIHPKIVSGLTVRSNKRIGVLIPKIDSYERLPKYMESVEDFDAIRPLPEPALMPWPEHWDLGPEKEEVNEDETFQQIEDEQE